MKWLRMAAFWLPFVLITWLALTPSPPDPVTRISDVILHMAAFTLLTGALAFAHFDLKLWPTGLIMLAYGALLEIAQSFTGRSPELKDLLVDAVAIALGLVVLRLLPEQFKIWLRDVFA
ncbi:MAG: VanZ family protein [Pseudomonadaceae bacterium]|nr:VanZ family protein [Pseudomonadaceae bacterium]